MNSLPAVLRRFAVEDRGYKTPCWVWQGAVKPEGYAELTWQRKGGRNAHRIVYEILIGPIPAGLHLDHLCRIRHCINPAHLEPVECRENLRRGAGAKITADIARAIRRRSAEGERQAEIAADYGVHPAHVSRIVRGWSWLEDGAEPIPFVRTPRPICAQCGGECRKVEMRYCSRRCVMLARHAADPDLRYRIARKASA